MEELSIRQKELLKIFYEASAPLSRDTISRELDISTRTVLSEIKNMNDIFKDAGIEIKTRRGVGYELAFAEAACKEYVKEEILDVKPLGKNASESDIRVKDIIRILIDHNSYITTQDIADLLYVSKQTISNDMKNVKKLLHTYCLTIESRAGYGLIVQGEERNKRKCLSYCLSLNTTDGNLFEINTREAELFEQVDMDAIFHIVSECIEEADWEVMDGTEKILTMHIAISVIRIKKDIKLNLEYGDLKEYDREYAFVKKMLDRVGAQIKVSFFKEECMYILMYFVSCYKNEACSGSTEKNVKRMLDFIWDNYQFDFRENKELQRNLMIHMFAFENRAKFSVWVKNPILEDIKEKYTLFYEMAVSSVKYVYRDIYNIDEGEAGFVALHLAVSDAEQRGNTKKMEVMIVCPAGKCSGKIIEKKLVEEFGNLIRVSAVISYNDYKKLNTFDCDLILSSLSLESKGVPIYHIKGIPERQEIFTILQTHQQADQKVAESLSALLTKELYFPKLEFDSKQELLHYLCQKMQYRGYVTAEFEEQINNREQISSTYMGKGIAMPHPIRNECLKTGITAAVLNKELLWEKEKVSFVFIINVKESDMYHLNVFYDKIIALMKDYQLQDQLRECTDFNVFYRLLETVQVL